MVTGIIWRWKPRNGTGVIEIDDNTLVWFHLSDVHGENIATIAEGMPVDVDIERLPQGEYECRAKSVQPLRPEWTPVPARFAWWFADLNSRWRSRSARESHAADVSSASMWRE